MRKVVTIIAVIAFIACTMLYVVCFETPLKTKKIALKGCKKSPIENEAGIKRFWLHFLEKE